MKYANNILSLTKKGPQDPFLVRFSYLDEQTVQERYLPDGKIFLAGMNYDKQTVSPVSDSFGSLLETLLLSIDAYPYEWPLMGQKLDLSGYDLFETREGIQLSNAAIETAKKLLGIQEPTAIEKPFTKASYVTAPHLTKLSLVLDKASVLSELSFQMHATHPVRLASLVYESDIAGYAPMIAVDLDQLQITASSDSISILFGRPILAKRITFVLAQDNAEANISFSGQTPYDYTHALTKKDEAFVAEYLKRMERTL